MSATEAHRLSLSEDNSIYRLLSFPAAIVHVRLASPPLVKPEIQILGNRAGLFSIANVLLWFFANASRREFLSLGELPFVREEGSLSLVLRMEAKDSNQMDGSIRRTDPSEQFEWHIADEDLRNVALAIHRLASVPEHEYDRLRMCVDTEADVLIRMIDAKTWLERKDIVGR